MHAPWGQALLRRLARDGYIILAVAFVLLRLFGVPPWDRAIDAFAYWSTRDGSMYDGALAGTLGAYLYSPAFAEIMAPLVALPWQIFLAVWTAILLAAYGWTVRLAALPLLLFIPIPADIATGNIHLLFAAAIVAGFRFPAAWAFMALTKVTPFIGVLWFAARMEWRRAIACGATAAIAGVSIALDPSAVAHVDRHPRRQLVDPGRHAGLGLARAPDRAPSDRGGRRGDRGADRPGVAAAGRGGPGAPGDLVQRARDPRRVLAAPLGRRCPGQAVRGAGASPGHGRRAVTAVVPAVPARRWDGPLLLLIAGVLLASALVALPVLLKETTRDWTAYEQAAGRLATGAPLYVWELATEDDEYYLYPPGMAAAWSIAGSPQLLVAAKLLALLAVGVLAPLVVADPSRRRVASVLLAAGAVVWPPNLYDLVLGNVMALYVGATAVAIARRGWLGRCRSASSSRWRRSPRSSRSSSGWRSGTRATRPGRWWWPSWPRP